MVSIKYVSSKFYILIPLNNVTFIIINHFAVNIFVHYTGFPSCSFREGSWRSRQNIDFRVK